MVRPAKEIHAIISAVPEAGFKEESLPESVCTDFYTLCWLKFKNSYLPDVLKILQYKPKEFHPNRRHAMLYVLEFLFDTEKLDG